MTLPIKCHCSVPSPYALRRWAASAAAPPSLAAAVDHHLLLSTPLMKPGAGVALPQKITFRDFFGNLEKTSPVNFPLGYMGTP